LLSAAAVAQSKRVLLTLELLAADDSIVASRDLSLRFSAQGAFATHTVLSSNLTRAPGSSLRVSAHLHYVQQAHSLASLQATLRLSCAIADKNGQVWHPQACVLRDVDIALPSAGS